MSKQSEAKKNQNYRAEPDMCCNCAHYKSEMKEKAYEGYLGISTWTEEKSKRCSYGGFKVNKTAVCDRHISSAHSVSRGGEIKK